MIQDHQSNFTRDVLLSGTLSVLEALAGDKLPRLLEKLQDLAKSRQEVLQWVSTHCGIPGNGTAGQLAKTGARGQQPEIIVR